MSFTHHVQLLEEMIRKKSHEYGMDGMKTGRHENIIDIYSNRENYHLFYTIKTTLDVSDLPLQYQIKLEEKRFRVMIFVDPIMLDEKTKSSACILANEMNSRMRIAGKYVVDFETGDFLYDVTFSYEALELMPEYVEKTVFDHVISFWEAIHIPFIMLTEGMWKIDQSLDYLNTFIDQGWIDNASYGL